MTTLLTPIFSPADHQKSLKHRFFSLVSPIQSCPEKKSDYIFYFFAPPIDICLSFVLLVDLIIELINALICLFNALYTWTISHAQHSDHFFDATTRHHLDNVEQHLTKALYVNLVMILNPILSMFSWITRPMASIAVVVDQVRVDTFSYGSPQ